MEEIVRFIMRMRNILLGKNEYKTKEKRYFTFASCSKFLLTFGSDEQSVKKELNSARILLDDETITIQEFKILQTSKCTITIPPSRISLHEFNSLVQYMTDEVNTVGLVESDNLSFTVYDDPKTINVIGQTDQGENFFISRYDNFSSKQFLRLNDDIGIINEYSVSRIKSDLSSQHATT